MRLVTAFVVTVNYYQRENAFQLDKRDYDYLSPYHHEVGDIIIRKVNGVPRICKVVNCDTSDNWSLEDLTRLTKWIDALSCPVEQSMIDKCKTNMKNRERREERENIDRDQLRKELVHTRAQIYNLQIQAIEIESQLDEE